MTCQKSKHYKEAMKIAKKMLAKPSAKQVKAWKSEVMKMIGGVQ
jgi:hypothetical protein